MSAWERWKAALDAASVARNHAASLTYCADHPPTTYLAREATVAVGLWGYLLAEEQRLSELAVAERIAEMSAP